MQILLGILDSIRRGIAWATGTITTQYYYEAVYAPLTNGSYFAFGASSGDSTTTAYQYSADGNTWTAGTLPLTRIWQAAATNGSRIVVFPEATSSTLPGYYTDNGTTWTATNALHGTNLIAPTVALWDGTRFVITEGGGDGTGTVRYSTDGITWSGVSVGGGSQDTTRMGYDGVNRYIVLNGITSISSGRTTATFPTGWTTTSFPSAQTYANPVYGNSIWVLPIFSSTLYYTSPTGTGSWTSRTLPTQFTETSSDRTAKMLFTSGKFYYYYLDNVYSSADGINWVTETTVVGDTLDNVSGWAVGPNKVIGVGNNGSGGGSGIYLNGSK